MSPERFGLRLSDHRTRTRYSVLIVFFGRRAGAATVHRYNTGSLLAAAAELTRDAEQDNEQRLTSATKQHDNYRSDSRISRLVFFWLDSHSKI